MYYYNSRQPLSYLYLYLYWVEVYFYTHSHSVSYLVVSEYLFTMVLIEC